MTKTDKPNIGIAEYGGWHTKRTCSVEECGERYYSLGFCLKHYIRHRRHGSPLVCVHNADRKHVKLSDEKALEIRKLREAGFTLKAIAEDYGVHVTTIGHVVRGISWPEKIGVG